MKTRKHTIATGISMFLAMTVAVMPVVLGAMWKPAPNQTQGEGEIYLPPPPPPPLPPYAINVVGREATSISLSWSDVSAKEDGYDLQRWNPANGQWTFYTTFGPGNGVMSFDDESLEPDTEYCYRVRAFNTNGQSFSPPQCVYTKDGKAHKVWRAQLTLRTANVEDANTSDHVEVRLNSNPHVSSTVPSGNSTWVDYGRNDFEKGDEFTYDLNISNINELGDINRLSISKTGTNGWCIETLALHINGIEVYQENFSSTSSPCKWLDNENGHVREYVIPHSTLRDHPSWAAYDEGQAQLLILANGGILREEMESRIESIVGHSIRFEQVGWGHLHGRAVEVTKGCPMDDGECQTIHVDLDLYTDVLPLKELEVDVDFDLNIQCVGNELHFDSANEDFHQESDLLEFLLSLGLVKIVDEVIEYVAKGQWQAIHENFDVPYCPTLHVDDDGNIKFVGLPTTLPGDQLVKDGSPYSGNNDIYDPSKGTSSDSPFLGYQAPSSGKVNKAFGSQGSSQITKPIWDPGRTLKGVQPNGRR